MSEPTPDPGTMTYADPEDVVVVLGKIGPRVLANETVDLAEHLSIANVDVREYLRRAYPRGVPTFTPEGLTTLRWAEARIAAAAVLDILRASMPTDVAEVPERLRASAFATLAGGVPGSPVGDDTPGPPPDAVIDRTSPRHSAYAVSNFADPYDPATFTPVGRQGRGGPLPGTWSSM